jgi:plastocyanin
MKNPPIFIITALALFALVVAGCVAPAGADLQATQRTFYVSAIEPKGTTNAEKESFPAAALPEGGGYKISEPDSDGNWTVSTYVWMPSEFTVYEGDTVTLEIVGINGASHPSRIDGYDISFDVKRGQVTSLTFTADKAGVFTIFCDAHHPSMTGTLVVLPRS